MTVWGNTEERERGNENDGHKRKRCGYTFPLISPAFLHPDLRSFHVSRRNMEKSASWPTQDYKPQKLYLILKYTGIQAQSSFCIIPCMYICISNAIHLRTYNCRFLFPFGKTYFLLARMEVEERDEKNGPSIKMGMENKEEKIPPCTLSSL